MDDRGGLEARVSVVIPTIGRDLAQLDRAVRSSAGQSLPPIEVIVVDDCRGNVLDVTSTWRDLAVPIRVVRSTRSRGPSGARNHGAAVAVGDWVAFLDDDDWWHPRKLEYQVARLRECGPDHHRFVAATRGTLHQDEGSVQVGADLPDEFDSLVEYLFVPSRVSTARRMILTPSLLVSRRVVLAEPFDEELEKWEDVEWLLRLGDRGVRVVSCPETLTFCDQCRRGVVSQSGSSNAKVEMEWASSVLAPRSRVAYRNFVLTHVVRHIVLEGSRTRAVKLIVTTAAAGRVSISSLGEGVIMAVLPIRILPVLRTVRSTARRAVRGFGARGSIPSSGRRS